MNIYIIGYGYIGQRIADLALKENHTVHAFSRSDTLRIAHNNFFHHYLDLDSEDPQSLDIPSQSLIFYLAPPPPSGISDVRITRFLELLREQEVIPARILYFSATGVYGDCEGEWITEESPVNPQADRSKRRLDAEQQIQHWCKQVPTDYVILRVAGIYGPNRLPLDRLGQGMKVLDDAIAPSSNRIHADDLAELSLAAMFNSPANELYNAADGHPSSMTDYFSRIAELAGLPQPERISMAQARLQLSPQMMSYLSESKKLNNDKAVKLLGHPLRYPSLELGLANCFGKS